MREEKGIPLWLAIHLSLAAAAVAMFGISTCKHRYQTPKRTIETSRLENIGDRNNEGLDDFLFENRYENESYLFLSQKDGTYNGRKIK